MIKRELKTRPQPKSVEEEHFFFFPRITAATNKEPKRSAGVKKKINVQ